MHQRRQPAPMSSHAQRIARRTRESCAAALTNTLCSVLWASSSSPRRPVRPMSSSRGFYILGPVQTLVSSSDSILILLPLCFKFEHFIIYVSLLLLKNSYNNSLFGSCMCVLCVNALVLAPRMNPD
jgi:hypothetical protein